FHKGEHSRVGATDVCPFIPVAGVTMDECVELANRLGMRVAGELGIPVYLYERAARFPGRANLAEIRKGEYEGLSDKLAQKEWRPDYGEPVFNPRSGATVIGAREFLIAYNVNLNTTETSIATAIARHIRESGGPLKDAEGKKIIGENGEPVISPGVFKDVKAVGWFIEEYGIAQVSINLTNYRVSPMHLVMEECRKKASELGAVATGSEIVGLVPERALLDAGAFYLRRQGKTGGAPGERLLDMAVRSLGLNDLYKFEPSKKVIEYMITKEKDVLLNLSVKDFSNELSSESPAPGGGSAAALAGALAAALACMASALTVKKKDYAGVRDLMDQTAIRAQEIKDSLLKLVDEDAKSFNTLMDAYRLPKKTPEEEKSRENRIQEATYAAALVPLEAMKLSVEAMNLSLAAARDGNRNSVSDAGTGGALGEAAASGAYYNVLINAKQLRDEEKKNFLTRTARSLILEARAISAKIREFMEKELG
ncbi:MAG: glutamate formimidoyltransferase, partial [Deltaproteobacteria bacterium]|nr:glutamate formimidoyltransferase [Deltaproteobacteria bacterium]